jgi:hypothetical protein
MGNANHRTATCQLLRRDFRQRHEGAHCRDQGEQGRNQGPEILNCVGHSTREGQAATMGNVVAVFKERPFDGRVHVDPIPVRDRMPSIREIIANAPELPVGFDGYCEARINGDLIPRDVWRVVRPKAHPTLDVVVTFTVPLQDGGGGVRRAS